LEIIHLFNRQVARWFSGTSCETSKGIAEVVDFFQNYGLPQTNAKLFSLQDELWRILCASIGSRN